MALARGDDLEQIGRWLQEPAIYQDAFMLAAPPDPAWVRESMLLVKHGLRIEFEAVRLWSVRAGAKLVGFGIDYAWRQAGDSEREIDLALPAYMGSSRFVVRVLAGLIDTLFAQHGATAVWGRVRLTGSGHGFPRAFALLGGEAIKIAWDEQPTTGARLARIYYRCTPESFYAARRGR